MVGIKVQAQQPPQHLHSRRLHRQHYPQQLLHRPLHRLLEERISHGVEYRGGDGGGDVSGQIFICNIYNADIQTIF
jgi:hypothetical protein